jgi:Rieske Fe-S protein
MLTGAGAAAVLAGCQGGGASAGAGPSRSPARSVAPSGTPAGSARPVIRAADIPVRGGAIYPDVDDDGVVVTQPSAGVFRAFSATCTHRGCVLASVGDGTINCPCHGARFSISDGSVVRAGDGIPTPTTALAPKRVTVSGDQLIVD